MVRYDAERSARVLEVERTASARDAITVTIMPSSFVSKTVRNMRMRCRCTAVSPTLGGTS